MEECPPGSDYASVKDDPSKTDYPPATWTPSPAGEQAQGEGLPRGDDVSQTSSHSPELKRKKVSATSESQVLKKYEDEFFNVVNPKLHLLRLKRKKVITEALISKIEIADSEDAKDILFEHLLHNADDASLRAYCKMAIAADAFPKMQKLGEKMLNELTLEGAGQAETSRQTDSQADAQGLVTSPSDLSSDLESYKLDIVSCDLSVVTSKKNPQDAIKSLFFNAYSLLVHILGTCFSTIKEVALDAVQMKQVAASREKVMEVADLRSLFECLEVDKKWNDLHILDVAISRLPRATKAAARMVLGHYKSHLGAYTKAVSIKEGKAVLSLLQRKCDSEGRSVVAEITVDKDIDEYTCNDCLILWKEFLVVKLGITEGSIQFCGARPGNSTTLLFTVPHTFAERAEMKLSQPDVVWMMKELGILRVRVVGVFNVDLREVVPAVPTVIREGLESGVDFFALTKVWSPLMCSLVDQVPEPKETQLSVELPYSVGPAGVSLPEPVVQTAASVSLLKDLLVAAAEGRLHEVQSLLDGGRCKVNDEDEEGFTSILTAALNGRLTVLQTLVEQYRGDVLHRMKRGRNAFHLCAEGGHLAVAEYLAPKMEGHLFDSDDAGNTTLHLAAYFGQLSMVEYLVRSCRFDVKARDKLGTTPLLMAAQEGHAEVARFLLGNGSSVTEQDNDGWTAVLLTARYGLKDLVQELCETFGADFLHRKKRGRNAFHVCAEGGHLAVAEYLAPKMEGHLFDSDDVGYTALHWAAQEGQVSMVEYLVRSCGFDVKARDKWGSTPLLRAAQEGHAEVARFLLRNGSSVTEQDNDGWTAVLLAARCGHEDLVQELCETFGADFLRRKKGGHNAFDACAVGGHLAIAEYLASKMEDHLIDSDDDGYTALHWAAQVGQLSMVEYLVRSFGFDLKARDKWGYTPFLRAAENGHAEVARFLLKSGSVFYEKNSRGESALQIAVRKGHLDVVKVLVQVYRDSHMEREVDQYYMDLADDHHHQHVVEYLSSEFPSLRRKVPVLRPRPTVYPNVWSISGPSDPDY